MQKSGRGRRSIRLQTYDYSRGGGYFITTCTQKRVSLFGEILPTSQHPEGITTMQCNEWGAIVSDHWRGLAELHPNICLDDYVVMPNHFHGILIFTDHLNDFSGGNACVDRKIPTRRNMAVPKLIGRFKMQTAKAINALRGTPGVTVWQRNYWEHIIRDESEWMILREYILNNPAKWEQDRLNDQGMDFHVHEDVATYGRKVFP